MSDLKSRSTADLAQARSGGRMLLASIHDVGPRFEAQVDQLADRLARHLGGPRFAMLVVPDHWGEAPLRDARAFQTKLREWADRGVEMFVHGWFHKDGSSHSGAAGFKAKHMTAGEGEFLGLSRPEALRRMQDGRALIEDIIGRPATGFIAPAWLYGPGAREALGDAGFAMAEDHMRVWRPSDGAVLARGPVVTWASAAKASELRIRIAVHPGDTSVTSLLDSIDASLSSAAASRRVGRYADLLKRADA